MRGQDTQQSAMFSYLSPEDRMPAKHPLRPIRRMADEALKTLSPVFDQIYASFGRPSIAPEKLLRALLLQVLYTIRGEEMLIEQLRRARSRRGRVDVLRLQDQGRRCDDPACSSL
jgi:transposase